MAIALTSIQNFPECANKMRSFSITLIGKEYQDAVLLKVAHAFEQNTRVRERGPLPYLVPTVELRPKTRNRKDSKLHM